MVRPFEPARVLEKEKADPKNISKRGPQNRRSLGFPGFPVECYDFGQQYVVLFTENHIRCAVESGEAGNPASLGMTKGRVVLPFKLDCCGGLNCITKTVGRRFPMCGELRIGHGRSRTVRPLVYFLVCRHECPRESRIRAPQGMTWKGLTNERCHRGRDRRPPDCRDR